MALSDDLYRFISEEDERVKRVLLKRFFWRIFDRLCRYSAFQFVRGVKDNNDPRCQPHKRKLIEAGYTEREILKEAVREVVEQEIEEIYHHGFCPDLEDLTPYFEERFQLALAGTDDLVTFLADYYEDALRHLEEHVSK